MKVTLKEIAEIAGVHRSTVDKVIHRREGVSDKVRQQVQAVLDEMEYEPNMLGRALQKRKKQIHFAAILLKVDALQYIKTGIERALEHYNNFNISIEYYVVGFLDTKEQATIIKRLIDEGVHGIIISPINSIVVQEAIDEASDNGIIVITTNFDMEDSKRTCFVGQNGMVAGRIAARLMGEFLGGYGEVAVIISNEYKKLQFSVQNRENSFISFLQNTFPDIQILEPIAVYDDPKIMLKKVLSLLQTNVNLRGIYITGGGVSEVGRAIRIAGQELKAKVICYEKYPDIINLMKQDIVTCTLASDLYNQGYLPVKILVDYLVYGKKPEHRHCFTTIEVLVKESLGTSEY